MAQIQERFAVDVVWWPFELHPEIPPEGRHVDELLSGSRRTQQYREHLKAYAAEAGIPLASNRHVSNSHRALELAEFARDRGAFDAVHNELFRRYFELAEDIGDVDVLCDIAVGAGLNPDEFRAELLIGRYAALIDRTTAIARERGVTATPTMILGDRLVITGAQDLLVYEDALRRLGAPPKRRTKD